MNLLHALAIAVPVIVAFLAAVELANRVPLWFLALRSQWRNRKVLFRFLALRSQWRNRKVLLWRRPLELVDQPAAPAVEPVDRPAPYAVDHEREREPIDLDALDPGA